MKVNKAIVFVITVFCLLSFSYAIEELDDLEEQVSESVPYLEPKQILEPEDAPSLPDPAGLVGDVSPLDEAPEIKVEVEGEPLVNDKECETCKTPLDLSDFEKLSKASIESSSRTIALSFSPKEEATSNQTSASLSYSKPLMPAGYPATNNPVVYSNQNITINAVVRNLGTSSATINLVIAIKNASNDETIVTAYTGSTTLSAAGGATESKNMINITGSALVWNTQNYEGEFYVWMNVSPTGAQSFTLDTKSSRFLIGFTKTANFTSCRTLDTEYYPGDVVQLSSNCTIKNTGNKKITGKLAVQVHQYDTDSNSWNAGIGFPLDLVTPGDVTLNPNDTLNVVSQVGAVTWNVTNQTEAATYRIMVAITDSFGVILKQYIGANEVDEMENALPGILVEKFIYPTTFNASEDGNVTVTIRVRRKGHSSRDSGVFATGTEAGELSKTKLDITFVVDTSGSMGDDWESLVTVMQNIINSLATDADIKHDIFGLSGTYSGYTTYIINGVTYPIKSLSSGYMNGTPVFTDDLEGALKWAFVNNFSLSTDRYFSSSQSACSVYSPEASKIWEDDAESGAGNWDLVRWNYTTVDSNSSTHSFYSSLQELVEHLVDDAESGSAKWDLENFELVSTDSHSSSNSYYCGYASGEQDYFADSCNDFGRWSNSMWEVSGITYNSSPSSFLCNYSADNQLFFDDAEATRFWTMNSFHFNNTIFNSSNTSFWSRYEEGIVLFYDDFENGTGNWNITNWTLVNETSNSANHSMKADNMTDENVTLWANMTTAHAIDLTAVSSARLAFYANHSDLYYGYVYVSTDGGANWTKISDTNGYSSIYSDSSGLGWEQYTYDLTSYVGNQVLIRISFYNYYPSTSYYNDWFLVDDVKVDTFKFTNYLTIKNPLNYTNNTYPTLYFLMKSNTSSSQRLYLDVSDDGSTWSYVTYWYGVQDWTQESVSLSGYMDYPYLRFRVGFDSPGQYVFLDDIYVNYSTPCILTLTNPAPLNHSGKGAMKLRWSQKDNATYTSRVMVQYSIDNINWNGLTYKYGKSTWAQQSGDLKYPNAHKYLRFLALPSAEGQYAFIDDIKVVYSPECIMTSVDPLNLTGTSGRNLGLWVRYNTSASNYLHVEYSNDNTTWMSFASLYGSDANWTNKTYTLGDSMAYLRFRFVPIAAGHFAYVDDVNLTSKQSNNMTLTNYLDTSNITKLKLLFSAKYNTSALVYVQMRYLDGSSTWTTVYTFSGASTDWSGRGVDLTATLNPSYSQLVIRIVHAPWTMSDYIYVDDISFEGSARNNMTLTTAIDLTSAESAVRLYFETLYNTQGGVNVQVSRNGGTSWATISPYTFSGTTNLQWEKIQTSLTPYIGDNILLRFTHLPLWTSDYVCIDDVIVEQGAKTKSFDSEDWGPGTEYLAEEYGWRPDATKVIFPISDECAYRGNPCTAQDTQSILDAIEACQNGSIAVYPIHGSWPGDSEPSEILPLMNQLASACGGSVADADNTTELQDAVLASLISEIQIAGKNIVVSDLIVNNSESTPLWTTFKADGSTITVPANKKVAVGTESINTTFDKTYVGALASITAEPPEEVVITYIATLPDLYPGEKRDINLGGTYVYQEPLKNLYRYGSFNGAHIEVNPGADLIILFDRGRLEDLGHNATDIQKLQDNLTAYAAANNGVIYNLTKFRKAWESTNNKSAYQGVYNPINSATMTANGKWHWAGYPQDLRKLIHSLVIRSQATYVVLVGSDNVIPFMRIADPHGWENPDYDFVTNGGHSIVWSDFPYADINSDDLQDFVLSRLLGNPQIMATTVDSASSQYQSAGNNSLIAYKWGHTSAGTTQPAHSNLVNTFKNTFGFNNLCLFNESCRWRNNLADGKFQCVNGSQWNKTPGESDGVYYMKCNGESYVDRLDNGNAFIYSGSHGNNFRDAGNAEQKFSDDHYYWVAGTGYIGEPDFLEASDVVGKNIGNPFFVTKSCHGGSTYADDTANTNLPLAFLSEGAVGYVGATGYSPTVAGALFYSNRFAPLLANNSIGKAYMLAKRAMVMASPGGTEELLAKISHLYGIPTYSIDIPSQRAGGGGSPLHGGGVSLNALGYIVSSNISGNQTSINVVVNSLVQANVTTAENYSATIYTIPDADQYVQDGMPIVPVIVETIVLPQDADVDALLSTVSSSAQTFSNVLVPAVTDVSETQSNDTSTYSGQTIGLSGLYPGNITDYSVINESSGNKTVIFRVFPVQWNESENKTYFYDNITFGFVQAEVLVPMANADITTDLSSSEFIVNVRNTGSVDIDTLTVTSNLPGNISASEISEEGLYYSGNKSIEWRLSNIPSSGLESIKSLYATLTIPDAGNYTVNTTITYITQGQSNSTTVQRSSSGEFGVTSFTTEASVDLVLGWNLMSLPLT